MVGGTALNLSLLSRGVGEVTKNGHERIDVVFEPQDYYNFVDDSRRIYLPPIRTTYSFETPQYSSSEPIKKPHKEIPIPKTFTTRKGALLLFSEDMAHKTRQAHHIRRSNHHLDDRASQLSRSADEIDLRTVDDLAKYILSYGGQQHQEIDDENGVYLKFVHGRRKRDYFDRQIRPGFSAKRYLSSWTKCWDDQVLEKVISKGYLTEKSLFYYNPLMPHLQRRLNDDMSHYPTPYKLMRSMLMSPGSLSGYTFYRVRPESAETIGTQDYDMYGVPPSQGPAPSIKVISTKDGVQREVTYASLDKKAQEEVLTDLLVKSAVHYAMKKQQEYFEDSLARAMDNNTIQEVPEGGRSSTTMPQFDMKNAVASLLDANKGKAVIETDFPEDKSQKSERSSSMRTKPIKHKSRHGKDRVSVRSHTSSPASDEKEYIGNVPVVQFRDGSGSPSSIPQLPHIPGAIPLTPIGETSREQTTVIQLPPIGRDSLPAFNILPPTPQHTILDSARATAGHDSLRNQVLEEAETEEEWGVRGSRDPGATAYIENDHNRRRREDRPRKKPSHETAAGIVPSGGSHLQSSSESLGATTSVHSLPPAKLQKVQWKGSQQSVKSYGSKRGPGSQHEDGSLKGSVVFGPDGEPINVGGTIAPHPRQDHIDQFHDANIMLGKDLLSDESENDEPDEWKHNRRLPRGQRDMMRNYANRRVLGTQEPKVDLNTDQKKELVVRIMTSETEEPVFVRVQYTPSTPSDKSTEIDYTSGDIDATLSINSWSYMPRDYDAEFDGIKKASSLHSLPAMPDMSKEITILSRATEKTEPVIEAKDDSIVEVKVPPATDDTLKPMTGSEGPGTDTLQSMLQSPAVTQSATPGGRITSILDTPFNMPEEIVPEEGEIIEPEIEEEREATPVPTPPPAPPVETQLSRTSLRRESRQSFVSEKPLLSRQTSERKLSRAPSVEGKISRSQGDSKEERRVSVMSRGASKESLLQRNLSRQSVTQEQEVPQTLQETVNGNEVEEVFEEQTDDSDGQLKVDGEQIVAPKDPTPEETTPRDPTPEEETAESPPPADEATPERADSAKSKVSEKEIVDALSDHAQQIASSILSRSSSGRVLEEDVRKAAELWMETHPVRDISRSQSVQDQSMVKEIMDQQNNRKSAGPTAGEYRELIKENLTTALSNASGLDKTEIPSDAEVSPELIQTLSKESVSPEDLEVVKDEESGKNLIRTKSQMSMAMGGVKEGHIFVPVAKNGRRASASIPNDRASNADIGEFEVINYGEKDSVVSSSEKAPSEKTPSEKTPSEKSSSAKTRSEKAPSEKTPSEKGSKTSKSQPPSIMGESIPEEEDSAKDDVSDKKSRVSFKDEVEVEDEFKKAVEELEQKSQSSLKSGKSGSPDEGKKSKASVDKATTPAPKKKEEFVVGKVDTKDEIKALYGQPDPPPADPTPPTMAKEKSPTKEPTPPPEPPAKTPPKSAEKKKPPPVVSEEKPPVKSASMAKQSVSSHSEDMETKIRPVPKVSEEKIKSASTAKQSSTSRSEEMAEIQQGFKDEIKNLFGKVPAKDKGRVDHKDELKHLFGGMSQPGTKPKSTTKGKPKKKSIPSPVKKQAPPAKPKKGKKGKKKEESPEPKVPEKPPTPPPPKEPTPPPPPPPPEPPKEEPVDYESERRKSIVQNINTNIKKAPSKESVNSELKSEESFEFNIVRDTPSPSPPPQAPSIPSVEEEPDEEEEELLEEEDDEAARLRMISNKEARAAKRAAQAEKRRQEVEKRRREREDQLRREKEEFERQQLLKAELEEERRKVEEQRRLRREQQDEERDREEREEMERLKRQKQEEERERKRKEDYQRKLEEMKKRQQEEEQRRHEEMLRKQKEEEERREAELEMLAKMEEEERLEYERKKKLEEEERLKKEEEEKRQREEEAKKAMEEARRLAEEMARKQAEMEARLKFNRNLQVEANGMKHSQDITRAFVFSYFELLQWLGLDIPEFELLKLNQY